MNAWAFGTAVLVVTIIAVAVLLDRRADRGHELRWEERFYRPELPVRPRKIIDVGVGSGMGRAAHGVPDPTMVVQPRRPQGMARSNAK